MRYIYGLFVSMPDSRGVYTARFSILTRKQDAIKFARIWHGVVGRVPHDAFIGGRQYGVDAPTFYATMDLVADFSINRK